jgi:DNA-binding XRE family transcriptional regulator
MNGNELRKLRAEAGITQVELAAFLNVRQPTISAMESRERVGELLTRRVIRAIDEMARAKSAA